MSRLTLPAVLSLLLATPLHAQGKIWVVDDDGGPGVDFTDVQAAADAAAEGDGLLVKGGSYGGLTIDGKSLVVIGEVGELVEIADLPFVGEASVIVRNLAAGQQVLLLGLDLSENIGGSGGGALRIEDCAGRVWAEDTRCESSADGATVAVADSTSLVLARCETVALNGAYLTEGHGLDVAGAAAFVYDSTAEGSAGSPGPCGPIGPFGCPIGGESGAGAVLTGATLFASGSAFRGGAGLVGPACPLGLGSGPADGGDGLRLADAASAAEVLDTLLLGGPGGAGSPFTDCGFGASGDDVDAGAGSFAVAPGAARSLEATTPVRVGETVTLDFRGEPGDVVGVAGSAVTGDLSFAGAIGPLLPSFPLAFADIGTVPASGEVQVTASFGAIGAGLDFQVLYVQPYFLSGLGVVYLGAPSALVVLAAGL